MNLLRTALAVSAILVGSATANEAATYTVTVESESPDSVHVRGAFTLHSPTIGLVITSSPQLEDGQAALIRDLRVRRASGEPLDWQYEGSGDWSLPGTAAGDEVVVDYNVALEHDRYDWRPGIDEVAYRQEDGLFFTGYSLFILPGIEPSPEVTVRFRLPAGWRASTPWERAAADADDYRVASLLDLGRNCLFLGRHLEESISLGEFTFVLALGGELRDKKKMFVDAMAPVLPAYVEMFGGLPLATRYLVVINASDRSDGGAFLGSYSMLIDGEVTGDSRAVWGHGIAHELAHFWNGHAIAPASETTEEWFKEGFTDYLTLIQLSRSGLDPWAITSRKLENMVRRYVIAKRLLGLEDSLRTAGADKHRKRFLVYGGGALAAFALDVRIRESTGNQAGFDELMQAMYRDFGATRTPYTLDDVVRVASEISGRDEREFFERFVDGTEMLDFGSAFDAIGMRLTTMADEFYLSRRNDAIPIERSIARSILGTDVGL